jgi:hypothetical protein
VYAVIPNVSNQKIRQYIVTVTDKVKVNSTYLIYAENSKQYIFENTDSPSHGKYNDDEIQSEIVRGRKYILTVVGYWIPLLGRYPNILDYQEVIWDAAS